MGSLNDVECAQILLEAGVSPLVPVWKPTSASGSPISHHLGGYATVLAPSSGEEPISPRHQAGVASMAWVSSAP
jgi:hypothetical protein